MKRHEIYPEGKFMKATKDGTLGIKEMDFPETFVGKVKSVTWAEFDDGRKQTVLHWENESVPALGLNGGNFDVIDSYTGNTGDDDAFVGAEVECYVIPDTSGWSKTGYRIAVRKPRAPKAAANGTAPSSAAAPPPPDTRPMGDLAEGALNEKIAAIKGAKIDDLRDFILSKHPGEEAKIASAPATWPRCWGVDIKAWIEDASIPF